MELKFFRIFMRLWSALFAMGGLLFVFCPSFVNYLLNTVSLAIGFMHVLPLSDNNFWLALAGSMMMSIAYLSFALAQEPYNKIARNSLLLCKFASSFFFAYFFFKTGNSVYLLGTCIDFPIFLIFLYVFSKTNKTRS